MVCRYDWPLTQDNASLIASSEIKACTDLHHLMNQTHSKVKSVRVTQIETTKESGIFSKLSSSKVFNKVIRRISYRIEFSIYFKHQ